MIRMKLNNYRKALVCWLYFMAMLHFISGVLMTWAASWQGLDDYHNTVLTRFWREGIPVQGFMLEYFWFGLFGATLQYLAVLMLLLVYVGNRYKDSVIWMVMIAGLLLWAPQDILISLQANLWVHVWVDLLALFLLLPPLALLGLCDRNGLNVE